MDYQTLMLVVTMQFQRKFGAPNRQGYENLDSEFITMRQPGWVRNQFHKLYGGTNGSL
jgi:hypothetical protein